MAMMNDHVNPDISGQSFATQALFKTIRMKFSKVWQLSTDTLALWLQDENVKPKILLLDVRDEEEVKISQIEHSVHVKPDTEDLSEIISKIKTMNFTKVVAYCSLGYRSSMIAQKLYSHLQKQNFDVRQIEIYNLEGSIFKWANEGREGIVDNEGKPCKYVHPYNTIWSKFLDAGKRKWPDNDSGQ